MLEGGEMYQTQSLNTKQATTAHKAVRHWPNDGNIGGGGDGVDVVHDGTAYSPSPP